MLEPLLPSGAKRLYVETVLLLVGSTSRREAPSLEPLSKFQALPQAT